jgi:hypothetical protein
MVTRLLSPRREQLFKLAAVEPDAVAIRTRIENHRLFDAAVNAQQLRRVARAPTFYAFGIFAFPRRTAALKY